ncbi:hypothetical protein HDV03_000637 [Kappamyces sp. JEL0829]|nr:hypothetical protein HDV03_000637 [Kappamyces sp. JEL0829]
MTAAKVLIVFGASRGIGATLASESIKHGWNRLVIVGKTLDEPAHQPPTGSLKGVAAQIEKALAASHVQATVTPLQCDVRAEAEIASVVRQVMQLHGRIDAFIYNSGAIAWLPVVKTPTRRFDLMHAVNARGLYLVVQEILPIMIKQNSGRMLVVSPPVYSRFFRAKTAYAMTKVSMSVLAMGLAMELPPTISVACLWPATAIESYVTAKMDVNQKLLRKATVFSDAAFGILKMPHATVNGGTFVDDDFLREHLGYSDTDFVKYQVVPGVEPPRSLPKKFPSLLVEEQEDRGFLVATNTPTAKL